MEQIIYEGKPIDIKILLQSMEGCKIKRLDSPIRVHWYDNCIEGLYYINPHGITLNIKLEENLFKSAKMKFTCYGKKEDISEVERIVLSHIYADVGEEKEK